MRHFLKFSWRSQVGPCEAKPWAIRGRQFSFDCKCLAESSSYETFVPLRMMGILILCIFYSSSYIFLNMVLNTFSFFSTFFVFVRPNKRQILSYFKNLKTQLNQVLIHLSLEKISFEYMNIYSKGNWRCRGHFNTFFPSFSI